MGLAIGIGLLADLIIHDEEGAQWQRRSLAQLDVVLARNEDLPVPDDKELSPEHERVIEDAAMMMDSHLLCHSDAEGYYVPIDFAEPIFDDDVLAQMLGSSQALLRELLEVAPHIDIDLVDGRPTPAREAELLAIEDDGPLWRERLVWYTLFEAATLSIAHGSAIVFH